MAKKRASDTAALVAEPSAGGVEHTIRTRKIENGFVINRSSYNPDTGEYKSSESFSKNAPRIVPPKVEGGSDAAGGGSLKDAVNYLSDKER